MPDEDFRAWSDGVNTDDPQGESDEPSSTVEGILRDAGLNELESGVSVDSLRIPLRTLSTLALEAGLDSLDFGLLREGAKRCLSELGISNPASMVDATLEEARLSHYSGGAEEELSVPIEETEPWEEAVSGDSLVQELVRTITRYVVLSPAAALTTAVWILFAHAHDAFVVSPLLAIISPTKQCGKTTLLTLVSRLVPRALIASNIWTAALFRAVKAYSPTLLIDEADTFLDDNEGLRGVLNSGHAKYAAWVIRTVRVGDDYDIARFSTWAPKCMARIGSLPPTLHDRSVEIRLRRKLRDDRVESLRLDRTDEFLRLRRQCVRWAADHSEALQGSDPALPAGLGDRAADNWRPLLSVAEQLGDEWSGRLRGAASELAAGAQEDDGLGTLLLVDLRDLFGDHSRLKSSEVARKLAALEHRPWPDYRRGQSITAPQIAALLRPFGIRPKKMRFSADSRRGYEAQDLEDAFSRYLPPIESEHPEHSNGEATSAESRNWNSGETVPAGPPLEGPTARGDVPDVPF